MTDLRRAVMIDYTNHRNERRWRRIFPTGRMLFENNEWHPETQWLIEAVDSDTRETRLFAIAGIHQWSIM